MIAKHHGGTLRKVDNVFIRIQPVYVGNVAWSCLKAKDKILADDAISGEQFFITDDTKIMDPFEFLEPYLALKGFKLSDWSYPYWAFITIFILLSWLSRLVCSIYPIKFAPSLTTATVRYLCNTYFFNRTKATLRLEYEPLFEHDESQNRSLQYYKKLSL